MSDRPKLRRGFAAMDPEMQREIASLGGRAAQASGKGHRFVEGSDLAKEAARKGGRLRHVAKPEARDA